DMPLLDTREKKNDLTGRFIADLVLQILSYVAQTEREFIKKRQAEGIAAAKEKGVKFGAKRKGVPMEFQKYKQAWENGEISLRKAARCLNISHTTFYRRCKE
ncbi:MAG: recombinase family protein, partial [Oscillospiraceae bacterium]|nr:recombinase family protein [Oscillospiraceae bacterium]